MQRTRAAAPPLGAASLATLTLGTTRPAAAQNLVVNGGFETGEFSGWTKVPSDFGSYFGVDASNPYTGKHAAFFAAITPQDTIEQTIPTVAGADYLVIFWVANAGGTANRFTATFDNTVLFTTANAASFDDTHKGLQLKATGPSFVLSFSAWNFCGGYFLDNVSVVRAPSGAAAVPKTAPATFLALGVPVRARRHVAAAA